MKIIITMAGDGKRFRDAGYNCHKCLINVLGKTLFEWSMESLRSFFNYEFIFITRIEHNLKNYITDYCDNHNITCQIVQLDSPTEGQADTVTKASHLIDDFEPICIYNIDTYVYPGLLNPETIVGSGYIPCFKGKGDHWSFCSINSNYNNRVEFVAEKERLSPYSSIGFYYFSSFDLFLEAFHVYQWNTSEKYIAPMYNYLIYLDEEVHIQLLPNEFVNVLGTPQEVSEFIELHKSK